MRVNRSNPISKHTTKLNGNSPFAICFLLKTKTAVNQRKMAYSGCFGTPGETRTHYIPLRRRTLYPGEVRGHIQKIFNYEGLQDSNGSIVRRRSLYTAELRGHRKIRTADSPAYRAQGTGSYYHSVFGGKSQLACKKLQRSSQ